MKRRGGPGASPEGLRTFRAVTVLRLPFLRRLVAGLALAGLLLPLMPQAEAKWPVEDRLAEILGHADAVSEALDASRESADPLGAFVAAYALATGLDADDIRAKLGGDALWLTTEIPSPLAVAAPSVPTGTTPDRALTATVPATLSIRLAPEPVEAVVTARTATPAAVSPRAHGARGP